LNDNLQLVPPIKCCSFRHRASGTRTTSSRQQ